MNLIGIRLSSVLRLGKVELRSGHDLPYKTRPAVHLIMALACGLLSAQVGSVAGRPFAGSTSIKRVALDKASQPDRRGDTRVAVKKVLEPVEYQFPKGGLIGVVKNKATGDFVLRWKTPEGRWEEAAFVPATKIDVTVNSSVEFDKFTNSFTYRYAMASLKSSKQQVHQLIIEFGDAVYGIGAPDGWKPAALAFRPALSWSGTKADPHGLFGLKAGSMLDSFSFRAFGYNDSQRFKERLGSQDGFIFHRASLPGVVRCWAQGYTDIVRLPGEAPESLTEVIPGLLDDAVSGLTVGPVLVVEPFDPVVFTAKMAEYNLQSKSQGWIDGKTVERVDAKLSAIRKAVQKKDYVDAYYMSRQLALFVDEDQIKKALSGEAYALVRFNAEYLSRQLDKLRNSSHSDDIKPK